MSRPVSERREEILAIAGRMFAEKGFASTTVREIADAAGILSGSLYHHFDSKESMVDEILTGFLDEMVAGYRRAVAESDHPAAVLEELLRQSFLALGPYRTAVAVMQNEFNFLVQFPRFTYLRKVADEAEALWVGVIEDGIRAGMFRSDIDPALVYRFVRDAVWVTVRWYRPRGRYGIDQIADLYRKLLFDGIARRR